MSPCGLVAMLFIAIMSLLMIQINHNLPFEYWAKVALLEVLQDGESDIKYSQIRSYDDMYKYGA